MSWLSENADELLALVVGFGGLVINVGTIGIYILNNGTTPLMFEALTPGSAMIATGASYLFGKGKTK